MNDFEEDSGPNPPEQRDSPGLEFSPVTTPAGVDPLEIITPLLKTELGVNLYQAEDQQVILQLPPETEGDWDSLGQQLQLHLQGRAPFWQPQTGLEVRVGNRLLDQRQLQELVEALAPVQLNLQTIETSRRQTAIAAATLGYSIRQISPSLSLCNAEASASPASQPLYLETTLRSGTEICHPGTVIVVGDLNPGSSIIAGGDIIVWGRMRGVVHAGASGDRSARIRGIYIAATQLRIADLVARTPQPPSDFYPEVAYATPEGIRIAPASQFSRTDFSVLA